MSDEAPSERRCEPPELYTSGAMPLQRDFYLTLERLRLETFRVDKDQPPLELDLRENRFLTGEEALRDRNRSIFLHRLEALGLGFGKRQDTKGMYGTAREQWLLRWKPDCEIRLVEASSKGATVAGAAAVALSERLAGCNRLDEVMAVVKTAVTCQLADVVKDAGMPLEAIPGDFVPLARAVDDLAVAINYRNVRNFDPAPLRPLLAQLFLRGTRQLKQVCGCDRPGVKDTQEALIKLNGVARGNADDVDWQRWDRELEGVAVADNLNPYLSGLACSILLEKGQISEEKLSQEVRRRLSPGIGDELRAGWFAGLMQGNRQALLARLSLWRQLYAYVISLQGNELPQVLASLWPACRSFEQGEIHRVVSNLVEIARGKAEGPEGSVDAILSEEEAKRLQEQLGDLDLNL